MNLTFIETKVFTARWHRRQGDEALRALQSVRLENPKGAYVPGMTAEVLVSPEQLRGSTKKSAEAAGKM